MGLCRAAVLLVALIGSCYGEQTLLLRKSQDTPSVESRFSVLKAPAYVNFMKTSVPLPASEVGPVSAFALGLASSKTLTWDGLAPGSLFHRPKASVMFVVDGVTSGDKLRINSQQSSQMTVNGATPASRMVNTVSSGKNLASHVSDLFGGSSLAVSMSSDKDAAVSAGARGKGSVSMFYDHASKQVVGTPASSPFAMNTEQIAANLAAIQLPSGFKFDQTSMAIVGNGVSVLSMAQEESASFLAELAALQNTLTKLSADSQMVKDNIPDVLTFTFSSLKKLHVQFGSDSPQVQAAMTILSTVIPQAADKLSTLYDGDAIVQVVEVAFNGASFLTHGSEVSALFSALADHRHAQTLTSFRADLPHIRLSHEASFEVACQNAQESVSSSSSLEVDCHASHDSSSNAAGRHILAVKPVVSNSTADSDMYNLAFVRGDDWTAAFTMFLIVFLIITLSTLAVCYVMWNMDPGSDSIIYRMTNQRIKMD